MLVRNFNRLCGLQGILNVRSVVKARAVSYLCVEHKSAEKSGLNNAGRNCLKGAHQISRSFSSASSDDQIVLYDEIKDLPNHPEKLLIDVREPDELVTFGKIPTSINIPFGAIKRAFTLPEKYFKKRYTIEKPGYDVEIIFSSKSRNLSEEAVRIVNLIGYKNVKNYKGSWIDWAEHEGIPLPS